METCWNCNQKLTTGDNWIGTCGNCGFDIDTNPHQPLTEEDINQLNQKGKNAMIPQQKDKIQYDDFIKLPNPLKNQEGEIKVGDSVKIISEFTAPENPKITSPLLGIVEINGQKRTVGLNWTSYYTIAKVYGKDTKEWVNKNLVYKGLQQFQKGAGHLWQAE